MYKRDYWTVKPRPEEKSKATFKVNGGDVIFIWHKESC